MDSARGGNKPLKHFFGRVSRVTVILLYVIFGGGESLVAGDITVQEVVGIARVVELAGVESIFAQGEYVVEYDIEGGASSGGGRGSGGGGGRGRIVRGSDYRGGGNGKYSGAC